MNRSPANGVLVSAFSNKVFGLDVASGQIRWEVELKGLGADVELAIEDGVVIAANCDYVSFIDYASGRVHASVMLPGEYACRPTMIVAGGHVFVAQSGEVSCFTTCGQPVWFQPFKGKGLGSVALALPGAVRQADAIGTR